MATIALKDFTAALELEVLFSDEVKELNITTSNLNRPGLALTGFFDYFATDRIQIIGKQEMTYLMSALDAGQRRQALERLMANTFPCLIVSRGMEPPPELLELAVRHKHPVFRSRQVTSKLMTSISNYLDVVLAPRITTHGVLTDVYGIGLLITGESGMGKSETALELIRRGHRLVADDVVEIYRISPDQLIGTAPENVRHFMEIRGIGIIDVRQIYGIGSVMIQKSIDMIAELEVWDTKKQYDRLGMDENLVEILDVPLPKLAVPVMPGRNLAIILEVAARNQRLKNMGYNSAMELHRRINGHIEGSGDI